MTDRLANKRVLITAAGSGIGRASAVLFAAEGARVAVNDIDRGRAEETVAQVRSAGGVAHAVVGDAGRWDDVRRFVEEARTALGGLDVLFNNAGISVRAKVHELDERDWDRVMDTTVKSTFLCSKAVIPHFLSQGGGAIVNTASTFGILASAGAAAYCTAKAGVILLTKTMALDYGPTVRVNCICPGATDTPAIRRNIETAADPQARYAGLLELNRALHRLGEPHEIAQAALFLASDESSFCTGTGLVVDGGQTSDA
jgi:NAD(P)-dependent dehydrogenase (short-subunit alcohol dehydrogenase family)